MRGRTSFALALACAIMMLTIYGLPTHAKCTAKIEVRNLDMIGEDYDEQTQRPSTTMKRYKAAFISVKADEDLYVKLPQSGALMQLTEVAEAGGQGLHMAGVSLGIKCDGGFDTEAANEFDKMMKDVHGEDYADEGYEDYDDEDNDGLDSGTDGAYSGEEPPQNIPGDSGNSGGTRRLEEDMDYGSVEQALRFMTMPPYTKDALGTYFRFDMGGGGDWCISCTHDANDMFSPFTDITYEADTNGDCVPKVKLTDDPEEEFQKLISVDGVSADCLLESIREARQDFYMDTPFDVLLNLRTTMRKASGAAPPTVLDGEQVKIVVEGANAQESTKMVDMTFEKYESLEGVVKMRKDKAMQSKCLRDEEQYQKSGNPSMCQREKPRIEKGSKAEYMDGLDPKIYQGIMLISEQDVVKGSTMKQSFTNFDDSSSCTLELGGLYDEDGNEMCTDEDLADVPVVAGEDCDYAELEGAAEKMRKRLRDIKLGNIKADAQLMLPYLASDTWFACTGLIQKALSFNDVPKTLNSKMCTSDWGTDAWKADPCCNYELANSMCCAQREVSVTVPEPSVDVDLVAEKCSNDPAQLTAAMFASKSYVETYGESVDAQKGCLPERERTVRVFESLRETGKECADEVMGEDNFGMDDGESAKSTKVCTADSQCYTGTCAAAAEGDTKRYCQTSTMPVYLVDCIMDKLGTLPKAKAIFKDIVGNGNMDATNEELAGALGNIAGRAMCKGQEGWKYDPNWRSCKTFDQQTYECTEYYCDDYEDCKTKCVAEKSCNIHMKDSQGDCETQELGGKFCGRCWNGDTDCEEVSSPPICRIGVHYDGSQGRWTDSQCEAVFGAGNYEVVDDRHDYRNTPSNYCQKNTITDAASCQSADACSIFPEMWGCRSTIADTSDCWKDGFYEEWINVGHGEYKPFCFVEGDDKRAKTEADLSCGADEEAVLIRSNEDMCQWTMCYKEIDNTFTKEDCWNLNPPANTYHHWAGNIGGDDGTCVIEGNDLWRSPSTYVAFKAACDGLSGDGFSFNPGIMYEEGKFHTEALCNTGVCDIDPRLDATECGEIAECDQHMCEGCERDWMEWDAPESVCIHPSANASACSLIADSTFSSGVCIVNQNQGPGDCDDSAWTYHTCWEMPYAKCGGGGEAPSVLSAEILKCQVTKHSRCNTQEECEASGECFGGLESTYCDESGCSVYDHICAAPFVVMDGGWLDCSPYGDWPEVMRSEDYCILLRNESACDAIEGAEWTSTKMTKDSCESGKKCQISPWMHNEMDETECSKCGKKMLATKEWSGATWRSGEMKASLQWLDREWSGATWAVEIDRWYLAELLHTVIDRLSSQAESAFIQCMYGGLIDSVEKVSCACGTNRESCDFDKLFRSAVPVAEITSYKDAAEIAGREAATYVEVREDSVESVAEIKLNMEYFIPDAPPPTSSSSRMMRGLVDANSINAAECSTVVTNDNGALVGQLVGDCVQLNVSTNLASSMFLCIDTKDSIEKSPKFTVADIASKETEGSATVYTPLGMSVDVVGSQYCFNVSGSLRACPILRSENWATATSDVASGECQAVTVVVTKVMKQRCKLGDSESCKWLEPGSTSFIAALAGGIIALIVVGSVIACGGVTACLHPKSRAVMQKHVTRKFFNAADKDGDGKLDKKEVHDMLQKEFGEEFSQAQLDHLFNKFDLDRDGQLDFEEYKAMITHHKVNGHDPEVAAVEMAKSATSKGAVVPYPN